MGKINFFSKVRRTYYSYVWLDQAGVPYYVGKGFGRRAYIPFNHTAVPPPDPERIKIFPALNESAALESEKALIELFGRRDLAQGPLVNGTDGGRGQKNSTALLMRTVAWG